ncbi:MAG: four helix bundle suffix domain-containing protein [Bacteroidaceae bacterium]|nr:four helix bundle suffix domain-containing protein [Bacteroidaceae bacterium]
MTSRGGCYPKARQLLIVGPPYLSSRLRRRSEERICDRPKDCARQLWAYNDPRCMQTRAFCKAHLDSAIYREKIKDRTDETIANIAITLIHQCDVLIRGLIEWKKRDFKEHGGIKEIHKTH